MLLTAMTYTLFHTFLESVTNSWMLALVLKLAVKFLNTFSTLNFHYQELFISNITSLNPLLLNNLLMIMLLFGIVLCFHISEGFTFAMYTSSYTL